MNRIYRVVWSEARRSWVVASELTRRHGKSGRSRERVTRSASGRSRPRFGALAPWRTGALASLLALSAPLHAADMYWDVNDTDPGLGGTGTWDLTTQIWGMSSDGVTGPYRAWDNALLDDAFFLGDAGTITLGAPVSVHDMTFGAAFTLSGSTLTLGGTTPTITTNANVTIDSVLAGTSGLTKTGSSGLFLNGVNTFSGDIDLNGGSIYANDDAALGAAGNNVTTAAGTLVRLSIGGTGTNRHVTIGDAGTLIVQGAGAGSALITGDGNVSVSASGVTLSNDDSTYTGTTTFVGCNGVCSARFTSIADLGLPSALGAPATVANGTIIYNQSSQYRDDLIYTGLGSSSNRNWSISGQGAIIHNQGQGTLTLTGDIAGSGGTTFQADNQDIQLLGVLSGANFGFNSGAGSKVTLAGANTYTGYTNVGTGTVVASVLADTGVSSSFGTGTDADSVITVTTGTMSYAGSGASTDRAWASNNGTIGNDGTGALTLSGTVNQISNLTLAGTYTGAANEIAGVISGTGDLIGDGAGTWLLSGANTRTGGIDIRNGTLRAGSTQAFGTTTTLQSSGGTLDLNDFDLTAQSLAGTGGNLALGSGTLTLNDTASNTNYAGTISGSGGLTKLGTSTQRLSGTNTYTGATTVGGGTLDLDFAAAGGPISDILSSGSTLNLAGGNLTITGADGEANTQTFDGVNLTAGTNNIGATAGSGGSVTLDLGAINRTGGLVDFDLPTSGSIRTNAGATLGGWATVNNGSSYAKVDAGGNIIAFTDSDYVVQDNPGAWSDGQFITDDAGYTTDAVDSADDTVQIGGLRYTAAKATTLNIATDDTLGVDGTILVAPSVGGFNQSITGGSLTGAVGGGTLGIQQNSGGSFTIASQIVDNGGAIGFTKAGSGDVRLISTNNTYTGATIVSQGTLEVASIANGGVASSIGASSADPSKLVLEGAELKYTGGDATTDRGVTVARSGAVSSGTIGVTTAAANLEITGRITSADGAGLTKTGAGTLTLSYGANDYTGATTISAGTLSVSTLANGGQTSDIGASGSDSSNLLIASGGTLRYTGATVSSDRGFTLNGIAGGVLDVTDVNTTLTLGGPAVGIGSAPLRKEGAGTLVLGGINTYRGQTTVNGGTLRAASNQAFGISTFMTLADASGVVLDLDGFDNKVGGLSGGGSSGGNVLLGAATLTLGGSNASYSGNISGTGGLYKDNSSSQTMIGCNNTYTGPTTIFAGTLSVNCLADGNSASGIGASSSDPANLAITGTLEYTGPSISIDRGFQTTKGTIRVGSDTSLELSGQVTGSSFIKDGAGTLVFSGTSNNYSGVTYISAGTLRAGAVNAFGTSGIRMDAADATLDLAGFDTTVQYLNEASSTANRNITLGGATLTLNGSGGTYSGVISGNGSLVKSAGSAGVLSGCDNSYTGGTRITGGVLGVTCLNDGDANSSIGNSSSDPASLYVSGTLQYLGSGSTTNRQFTLGASGGTLDASGTGSVSFTNTAPITLEGTTLRTLILRGTNTDDNTLAAQITDSGVGATRLTKADTGTWVLSNPSNTYTGITAVNGGVLSVAKLADGGQPSSIGQSSGAAATLVIGNGSTLRYQGAGDTTDRQFTLAQGVTFIESSGTGALQFTNTGVVTLSGTQGRTIALGGTNTDDNTMGGTIGDASASGKTTLAKNGPGTWVITGDNTYTGNTVINDGNLIVGNGGTTGNAGAGNVIVDAPTSTLSIDRSDAFDFNGTLSGPGTLAQVGSGTTRLTATGSSIGATRIGAGALEIDGTLTSATVAMTGTSTLNVDGTLEAAGAAATVFTGDGGTSTINVSNGATLRASGDLGDGSDTLNLAGTLDTGATALTLGAGDDVLVLNDTSVLSGTGIDAGTATTADTLQVDNVAARTLTGATTTGFERLIKQNVGVLTMTGNETFSAGTSISGGTLDVDGSLLTPTLAMSDDTILNVDGEFGAAGAAPTAISGSSGANALLVNAGASLRANGDLGDGDDIVMLAGALDTGTGSLALGAGDDSLTLSDGMTISGAGFDAGAQATSDQLILDNALALTFDGGTTAGFEMLRKQNAGTATMTGTQSFSAGTTIDGGTLDVDGDLTTPSITFADDTTLNVDGSVQAAGATQATLTGSAGANSILVGSGASLLANGDLGDGSDTVTIAGALDTGAGSLSLGAGDDTFTLNDGATIAGVGIDAGTATTNDALVLNNALALTFDGARTTGFESLTKQNIGVATMTGSQSFGAGTTVDAGTLDVDGTLQTPSVTLADGATLKVGGTVQAAGVTQASLLGSAGSNTVTVDATATLLATGDLGDGNDVLDVAGTLDMGGGGSLLLGDGDDTFTVHDNTLVTGTVDGGAGFDTRVYDINLTASVGALLGFEGLTKTGTGVLNLDGPGSTSLAEVEVLGGTLSVNATGNVTDTRTTIVGSGATLSVDGSYAGSTGNDTFTVAGTVGGAGSVGLGAGDDVLTLRDGANLTTAIDGGTAVSGDTLVLDNSLALTFDGTNTSGFEQLVKQNAGTATMTGAQTFSGGTAIDAGALSVSGTLNTPALDLADGTALIVAGTAQATGATQMAITGTAGVNTVVVNDGGTLLATGDLGAGDDVLDVAGTLDTGAGTFSLGAGNDTFIVHNTTAIIGSLDAGAGDDLLNVNVDSGNLVPLGSTTGFESLGKSGLGGLQINGASDFQDVQVQQGTLDIAAPGSVQTRTASVSQGATLNVDGAFQFTADADSFTVSGAVTGTGTIDLLDGDDELTVLDGADLSALATQISGGAGNDTLLANVSTTAKLGGTTGFETLTKQGAGSLVLAAASTSAFDSVDVQTGTLEVAAGASVNDVAATTIATGATLNVDGSYAGTSGNDTFTVAGSVSGGGAVELGAGDDLLTLRDGAVVSGSIDGGTALTRDTVVLDNAQALAFDGAGITGFERLVKQNVGTATTSGNQIFSDGIAVNAGTLNVTGTLETPTLDLGDDATLNVDGTMQAAGAGQVAVTGSAGVNTLSIGAAGTLVAGGDLGDGNDVLDVAGTLDAGGSNFNLGAGDDSFVIHDGTNVLGTVVGGAGLDTRIYDIVGAASVGALTEFEGLTKRNSGTLTITGPATTTDLQQVSVEGGTLDITGTGDVAGVRATSVAAGATLNVDGSYAGSTGDDTFVVAGTVSGPGSIGLDAGDDVLTLRDGAVLNAAIDGGDASSGDTLVLDNALALTFDGANTSGFETLVKQNAGTATMTGTQNFSDGSTISGGTLEVTGTLHTPAIDIADDTTLSLSGTVDSAGTMPTAITGTAGVNTVVVNAGGTLLATGDLGDGADILDLAGTLDTGSGAFSLGAGDDTFVLHNTSAVTGTLDAGPGNDVLNARIDGGNVVPLGSLLGFESLEKSGSGALRIDGASDFQNVTVADGLLDVAAGGSVQTQSAEVSADATLNVDGTLGFTSGDDTFTVAGDITGAGTIDMRDGDDHLTLLDNADLSGLQTAVAGGAGNDTLTVDIATVATLGGATEFETLTKQGTGSLIVAGPAGSQFDTVLVHGGRLEVSSGAVVDPHTTAVDAGATLLVDGAYQGTAGDDTFTLSGTLAGAGSIDLLDGDDTFTLDTGATLELTGVVDAAAASNDSLVLSGAGSDTFDLAQIGTRFMNFDNFRKEGTGTWELSGTSDRSWTISAGTLVGNTATFGGDIENDGTVIFDQATDGAFGGVLSGAGTLVKENQGTLVMTGVSTFTGNTQVAKGTLQVDGTLPGTTTIAAGAALSGIGTVGNVTALADASVRPGNPDDPFGTLTLTGNFVGSGGTLQLNTVLGNESSETSRLVVGGNTSGTSRVVINRAGGNGEKTLGDGIHIVQVNGTSDAGSFHLAQPVQAGAYEYLLYQGGASDANDWYLRSDLIDPTSPPEDSDPPGSDPSDPDSPPPAYRPGVSGYVLGHQTNLEYGFMALSGLRDRVGDQGRLPDPGVERPGNAWLRVTGQDLEMKGHRFRAHDFRTGGLQFGTDIHTGETAGATTYLGVMASVGESTTTFFDSARASVGLDSRSGSLDTEAKGAGLYWTTIGESGAYLDLTGQMLHYRNRYRDTLGSPSRQDGWGSTLSAEVGAPFALGSSGWRIDPHVQLAYQRLELDDFSDDVSRIGGVKDDALRARAAVQLFRAPTDWLGMSDASPYIQLGMERDFRDPTAIEIGDTQIADGIPDTTGDVSVGFTGHVRTGLELHLDLRYQQSTEGEKDGLRANFGFRMTF